MGVGLPPRYSGHIADGTVWDINSTCAYFGPKCLHIIGIQHVMVSGRIRNHICTVNIMCRSSRHSELATSRLSTAFRERGDTCEQVMEAEQRAKTKLPRAIQEIAMAMRLMLYLR